MAIIRRLTFDVPTLLLLIVGALWYSIPAPEPPQSVGSPDVILDCQDTTLKPFVNQWQAEIGRRFHYAVGILCHGGEVVQGQWLVMGRPGEERPAETVAQVVAEEQKAYPGRTIVVLACNPYHEVLHGMPEVYYFPSSVWALPDRDVSPDGQIFLKTSGNPFVEGDVHVPRSVADPDTCGNIFEAISAE
jgi:hypothetical protein